MSNEPNNKIISLDRLAHYHSKLDETIIQPLEAKVKNMATNPDINEMFDSPESYIVIDDPDIETFSSNEVNGIVDEAYA